MSDYLIGAGALLAVLAVSAAVLPRLRAGAQAVLALLLGGLATTLGALHLVETTNGTGSAWDAVSGALILVAGLAALAVGGSAALAKPSWRKPQAPIPPAHGRRDRARKTKEYWRISEAHHTGGLDASGEVRAGVVGFVDHYLLGRAS